VSDLFAPMSGEVVEVNATLAKTPEVVNQDPYGKGFLLVIRPAKPDEWKELLSPSQYAQFISEGGH